MSEQLKYPKVLLKISGETIAGEDGRGVSGAALEKFTAQLVKVRKLGVKLALVIGGGNFWRSRDFQGLNLERTFSDEIGMVATIMNGMVLRAYLECNKIEVKVFAARSIDSTVASFSTNKAKKAFEQGKVVILVGGTGHPFFTTDSAAILRSLELDADAVFKGTKVDGIYDSDPFKNPQAKKYSQLTFEEALEQNLKVLDLAAFALAMQKRKPLLVFDIFKENALEQAVKGESMGTLVY
jgi:uridylate kinase